MVLFGYQLDETIYYYKCLSFGRGTKTMRNSRYYKLTYITLVAPAFLIFIAFVLYPTLQTLLLSFYSYDGGISRFFIGFQNFVELSKDSDLLLPLRNSFYWIINSIFVILPLSFIFALIIMTKMKGHKFFRTLFYMPSILSEIAIAIIWVFIYNSDAGLLNSILKSLGLESIIRGWLYEENTAIFACIAANTWAFAGSYMLIFMGEMKGIPVEIYEAAEIDGALGLKRVFSIIIPLVWETAKVTVFLSICAGIQQFGLIYGLTGGGPGNSTQTLGTYMYKVGYRDFYFGYASTVAVLILIISYGTIYISNRIMKRDEISY